MEYRRVKYRNRSAVLFSNITNAETLKYIQQIRTAERVRDGYIVFDDSGAGHREVAGIITFDGGIRQKQEQEKYRRKQMLLRERQKSDWEKYLDDTKEDREFADGVKKSILEKKQVHCPSASDFLMNHQKAGVLIAERFPKYAFFFDTGTGKTLLALQIIRNKIDSAGATFLVLCPKSIIQTAWLDDCTHFFPKTKLMPLDGNYTPKEYQMMHFRWGKANGTDYTAPPRFFFGGSAKERTEYAKSYIAAEAECFVVNPERFIRSPEEFIHIKTANGIKTVDGIIVDESARLKNPYSVLTRTLEKLSPELKYLYLLSGKPAPNRLAEYLPQIDLVAPKSIRPGLRGKVQAGETPAVRKEMTEVINCSSVTVAKKDCFDLPETTEVKRMIEMDPATAEKYAELKFQMRVELDATPAEERTTKNIIYVNHVLSLIAKLREFTGGFLYDEKEPLAVHEGKVKEVLDVLEDLGEEPLLIWCQYQYEIERLQAILQSEGYHVATAYSKTKDLNQSIYDFKEGRAQILIAHPRTLQYGVTLVNCCYALYYSTSYSYEEYYQSHDRIYRKGQSRPCTYIFLQCKDTIDTVMFETIMAKQSKTVMIEQAIKHIYDETD